MSLQERRACPSHCCPKHGCKYDYDDCPVVTGKVQPTYPKNNGCEMCEREGDEQAELDRLQARVAELEALAVEAIVVMDALVRKSDIRLDRNAEIAAVCAWKIKAGGGRPIMQPLEALDAAIDTARKAKP